MNSKPYLVFVWVTRILALMIFLFALPFYFGYGNPLPFMNPSYTFWDNTWLSVFPFVFVGLVLGWFFPRVGGFMIVTPIVIGFILGMIALVDFPIVMLVPLLVGLAYIFLGYKNQKGL